MTDRTTLVPDRYDEYTATCDDGCFMEWLRSRSEPNWTEATTHRFTQQLGAGTLSDEVSRRYLVQDYAFLDALVGAFGHAVGQAPTMQAKARIVEFLAVLTANENDYFERAFEALDVPEAEYTDPDLAPATRTFEDLLERAARVGGYGETLAVVVPAEWIYLTWATDIAENEPSRFYLSEWIDLHSGEAFEDVVNWLRTELDREGEEASPRRQKRLARLFQRTVELETAFFESAYDSEGLVLGGDQSW